MLKTLALAAATAVAVLAVTGVLFGTVLAAGPGPKAGAGETIGGRDVPLAVAAELTGLTEEELLAELEGGKTMPVLLDEMDIDLSVFHQAVADARQAAVDEAVAAGTITPEQAQVMLQRMQERQAAGEQGPYGPQAGAPYGPGDGTCDETGPHGSKTGAGYGEPGEGTGEICSRLSLSTPHATQRFHHPPM
jgi:hypothetical protein